MGINAGKGLQSRDNFGKKKKKKQRGRGGSQELLSVAVK